MTTFEKLALSPETMKAISEMGFKEPTKIQIEAIPLLMQGVDLISQSMTGSGKTAAFGIFLVESVNAKERKPQAIVLTPTRELALQVTKEIESIGKYHHLSIVTVYGGASINVQIEKLRRGAHIIVGTPGRVLDMIKRKVLRLDSIRVAVLDEADRMLDMGFIDDVKEILSETPEFRQTLLFSATMPDEIKHLAKTYMKNPESLTVSTDAVPIDRIKQTYIVAEWKDKLNALLKILDREKPELAIVFVKTKFEASKLAHKLTLKGHNAISLHGNLSQNQRDKAMHLFRHGHARILVATDIAARGIDVTGITHIINYDLPMDPNTYSHRLGRTARAGAEGKGITLVTPEQRREIRDIQRAAGVVIEQEDIEGKPVQDTNEEEATLTNFGEGSYGTGFFKTTRHEATERRTSWKRDSRRQRTSHPRGGYHKHKYKR